MSEGRISVTLPPLHPHCRCSTYGRIDYDTLWGKKDTFSDILLESAGDKVYNQGMDRNKGPNKRRPINIVKQRELTREFRLRGGYIWQDSSSETCLDKRGADACCLDSTTVALRKRPTLSEVLEEIFHAGQYNDGKMDGSRKSTVIAEIEAQEYLLSVAEELSILKSETNHTRKMLQAYKKELKEIERNEK